MKTEHEKLLNECNSHRSNIYYQLNQLPEITGLSIRSLKYRMAEIKQKYSNQPSLLYREGKRWQIHTTLVNQFLPKKPNKKAPIVSFNWNSICTWNMKNSYDTAYHIQLLTEVKETLNDAAIFYAVEKDKRGYNHVHFISNVGEKELQQAVSEVVERYISKYEYKALTSPINNKYSMVNYLTKSPVAAGIF